MVTKEDYARLRLRGTLKALASNEPVTPMCLLRCPHCPFVSSLVGYGCMPISLIDLIKDRKMEFRVAIANTSI